MGSIHALTVDLEEYFHATNLEGVLDRSRWHTIPSRVVDGTRRLLDAFDATQNRATFFVLGWVARRHPGLVREIADRGHEIACHGYAHELVYEIGRRRFRDDLRRARDVIEDAAGVPMHGFRAPNYSITRRSLWALEILREEGFRFDSSIFPIRHHRYGIPDFPRRPVRIDLGDGGSIHEFPMTTLRTGPLVLPLAGGAYLRFLPSGLFRLGMERLAAANEPTVLTVHPWELDPNQPRQPVGWKARVNHYHNLDRVESRLRALLERFRFSPMGEVLRDLEAAGRLSSWALARNGGPPDEKSPPSDHEGESQAPGYRPLPDSQFSRGREAEEAHRDR
jgi:polysaccharide deacetylase family protein (PEP-CTERM system associated)